MLRFMALVLGTFCIAAGLPGSGSTQAQSVRTPATCGDTRHAGLATVVQDFHSRWSGVVSPGGVWRINGPWKGSGANFLDPTLARIVTPEDSVQAGSLELSVAPGEKRGSEIQTLGSYSYGYYETQMRVTDVPGVVASFFWIEAPGYGPHEFDVEFLTNEPWVSSADRGAVHLTIHPSEASFLLPLQFNPSKGFHRYGFLWNPGRIVFTIDGRAVHTFSEPDLATLSKGFIMMNTWTGNPNWGGGPPTQQATTTYACVTYTAGATGMPR